VSEEPNALISFSEVQAVGFGDMVVAGYQTARRRFPKDRCVHRHGKFSHNSLLSCVTATLRRMFLVCCYVRSALFCAIIE
jgi:hypothetical protein